MLSSIVNLRIVETVCAGGSTANFLSYNITTGEVYPTFFYTAATSSYPFSVNFAYYPNYNRLIYFYSNTNLKAVDVSALLTAAPNTALTAPTYYWSATGCANTPVAIDYNHGLGYCATQTTIYRFNLTDPSAFTSLASYSGFSFFSSATAPYAYMRISPSGAMAFAFYSNVATSGYYAFTSLALTKLSALNVYGRYYTGKSIMDITFLDNTMALFASGGSAATNLETYIEFKSN